MPILKVNIIQKKKLFEKKLSLAGAEGRRCVILCLFLLGLSLFPNTFSSPVCFRGKNMSDNERNCIYRQKNLTFYTSIYYFLKFQKGFVNYLHFQKNVYKQDRNSPLVAITVLAEFVNKVKLRGFSL